MSRKWTMTTCWKGLWTSGNRKWCMQRAPWFYFSGLKNTELSSFHFVFTLAFEGLRRWQPHKNKTGNENETDFWHCVSRKTTVWARIKHIIILGWRDGLEVKSIECSSRGPKFNSQQPHGGSQPSVMRSDAFWCASIHADRALYT